MHSTQNPNYSTPMREKHTRQEMSTGANFGKNAESHYRPAQDNDNDRLGRIQAQIKKIGDNLRQLHSKMLLESDKYSQSYLSMEKQRSQLRKNLIDLDFEHKAISSQQINQSRRKEEEEIQKTKQQMEQKLHEMKQKKKQNEEDLEKLAESRRKARMAEIQADLAQSKLRRSRIANLNAELDYLRLTYSDSYLWRYYYSLDYLPSYYYYYYPSYISDYLYPYSSLSYPYRYSSYLYPYSYWRLYY